MPQFLEILKSSDICNTMDSNGTFHWSREKYFRISLSVLMLAAGFLYFGNLGALQQFTRAEIYFAETAREMIISGDWITPRYCEKIFFDKPPLLYWLIAICFQLFDFSEAVARIPSVAAGLGTIFLTALFAARNYGCRAGILSGLVLLSTFGFWSFSRCAMSDASLTFFITAALFSYHEALRREWQWKRFVFAGYVCVGLALITKGPVGPVLVFFAVAPSLLAFRLQWKRLLDPLAILTALVIALPWYIAVSIEHGSFFWNYFLFGEHFSRFLGGKYVNHQPPTFYITSILGLTFPWSIWLPLCISVLVKRIREVSTLRSTTYFLFSWLISTPLFFSFSHFKMDYYVLPCFPALAIVIGAGFATLADQPANLVRKTLIGVTAVLLMGLAFLFWKNSLALFPDLPLLERIFLPFIAAAGGVLLMFTFYRKRENAFPYVLTGALASMLAVMSWQVYPKFGRYQSIPRFARLISREYKAPWQLATCFEVAKWHSHFRFYTGLPVKELGEHQAVHQFVQAPGRRLLILPEAYLGEIFPSAKRYQVIDRGLYLAHGLPGLKFFQRPNKPSVIVLVKILKKDKKMKRLKVQRMKR